jgi:hypothetical protein
MEQNKFLIPEEINYFFHMVRGLKNWHLRFESLLGLCIHQRSKKASVLLVGKKFATPWEDVEFTINYYKTLPIHVTGIDVMGNT